MSIVVRRWLLAMVMAMSLGAPVRADERAVVRVGNHAGFGRVVFELPTGGGANVVTEDGRVLIVFRGVDAPLEPATLPRNVRRLETGQSSVTLTLAPGAALRQAWLGNRLVLDAMDAQNRPSTAAAAPRPPAREATVAPAARPAPPAPAVAPAPVEPTRTRAEPPAAAEAPPKPGGAGPKQTVPEPLAEPIQAHHDTEADARPAPVRVAAAGEAVAPELPFLVPAPADVGAAVFARGGSVLLVLDRRLPVPVAPQGAQWIPGAVSMTLQMPAIPGATLQARRTPAGWMLMSGEAPLPGSASVAAGAGGLAFSIPRPGRSLVVLDPVGGGPLLVGTSLGDDPGSAVAERRRTPGYVVLATALGVAVEPSSDRVDMRGTPTGFTLTGAPAPVPADAGDRMSRRFDIPEGSEAELVNRLQVQLAGASGAAARSRTRERMGAARTMIALGMDLEAAALLQVVAAEDPQEAAGPDVGALAAIAAVLAARPAESAGLEDARLGQSDELAFWQALRLVRSDRNGAPVEALRKVAESAPLVWRYPVPLRAAVWNDVAEAAALSGMPVEESRSTPFAKALVQERAGQVDAALAGFDALEAGPDALLRVRAGLRATELRLQAGRIAPKAAAELLDRLALGWRGDGREAELRERAATLRGDAGEWKDALDALGELDRQFPDRHAANQVATATVLQSMLDAQGGTMSPLTLVLLAAEYGDRLPPGPQGQALARLLADKLMALDLPSRAIPVLQGLMRAAPQGEMRAEFGARLAQLLLDGGDAAGAGVALDGSAEDGLSSRLVGRRALLRAKVQAGVGDMAVALAGLKAQGTAEADDARATLSEAVKAWPAALEALADLRAKLVPPEGALTDAQQAIVLREASAASQASDLSRLRKLTTFASRMTGPRADLFRMLTAAPLATPNDLPRAGRELALAKLVPRRIEALSAP